MSNILLIGGTGFIGQELGTHLAYEGHNLSLLTRDSSVSCQLAYPATVHEWLPDYKIPAAALENIDTIINLAGESIASGRWNDEKKRRIIKSRTDVIDGIHRALKETNLNPTLKIIQASAIGIYGDSKSELVDETSKGTQCFLNESVEKWENSAAVLKSQAKVVTLRFGIVLGTTGGALLEMLYPYVSKVGVPLGSGKQFMSWVHIEDVCRAISFALNDSFCEGTYNLVADTPVTNARFDQVMRPYFGASILPNAPKIVLRLLLGEKADLLLMSQRVSNKKLLETGFTFKYKTIRECLKSLLDDSQRSSNIFHAKQYIDRPIEEIWDFFSAEENLERITPTFMNFHVVNKSTDNIEKGSIIDYKLKVHGIPMKWKTEILELDKGVKFVDFQLSGPYKMWHHTHTFHKLAQGTLIEDKVKFQVPMGALGSLVATKFILSDIHSIFDFRKKIISKEFGV